MGRYKLVSEPWFEGFGHAFGSVWTQTEGLKDFSKRNYSLKPGKESRERVKCVTCATGRAQVSIPHSTHTSLCYVYQLYEYCMLE